MKILTAYGRSKVFLPFFLLYLVPRRHKKLTDPGSLPGLVVIGSVLMFDKHRIIPRTRKAISFELRYWRKKIRFYKVFALSIFFIQLLILNYGDVQNFFLSDKGLIPANWVFFKDEFNVKIISILIIVLFLILAWLIDNWTASNEVQALSNVVKRYVVPYTDELLNDFVVQRLRPKYQFSGVVRASIFLPVRESFLQWRLQMVCKTKTITSSESRASFMLNEGVLGHVFLMGNDRFNIDCLDITGTSNLPPTYVELSSENRLLISRDIEAVVVLAFSQSTNIDVLLAIDTDASSDIKMLGSQKLHDETMNWMRDRLNTMDLIWRDIHNV